MPEYLAPGVYVEETSFRAKSIEGVGTSTTAFVGPTRRGPIASTQKDAAGKPPAAPELLTSFADFERMYGGIEKLNLGNDAMTNYLAHSVLQFFNEGGSRLYVARVANAPTAAATADLATGSGTVKIKSRFSGAGGNGTATVSEIATPLTAAQLNSFPDRSLLRVSDPNAAPASIKGGPLPASLAGLGSATDSKVLHLTINGAATPNTITFDTVPNPAAVTLTDLNARVAAMNAALPSPLLEVVELSGGAFELRTLNTTSAASLAVAPAGAGEVSVDGKLNLQAPTPGAGVAPAFFERQSGGLGWFQPGTSTAMPAPAAGRNLHALSFSAVFEDADHGSTVYDDLAFGAGRPRFPATFLTQHPAARADALFQPIWFDITGVNALELHDALFPPGAVRVEDGRSVATHTLAGGTDGQIPMVGTPTDDGSYAAAFELLRGLEDISIVAAPGHSAFDDTTRNAVCDALLAHAGRPRAYRIAVLDSPPKQMPGEVRDYRARIDSNRAALYYPWVTVANPLARPGQENENAEINLPPSGFICGIYARNDVEQSVSKAPGNEVVRGALRFETDVNFAQQQLLNPLGINCLRFFPGRGLRVWGARTASSDPEFKYVNVRRFFLYLEASIDRGTQWVVFENNGPRLWANVRETVEAFLYNEWVSGNLLGATPKEAFFVRCDRSTMTQNDLDNGRLICLVGVAALKPAEFVIFRIGQKTADERS